MYTCVPQYVICHVKSKNDQKKNIEIFLLSGTSFILIGKILFVPSGF